MTRNLRARVFRSLAAILLLLLLGQSGWLLRAEVFSIRLYQQMGSPIASRLVTCRFEPTCSNFALEALQRDGLLRGNLEIAGRLLHCSPLGVLADAVNSRPPLFD